MATGQELSAGFRLSAQQEHLLDAGLIGPGFRSQYVVELRGELDEERLCAAVEGAVRRHEILRTTFARTPGIRTPSQTINEWLAPAWDVRAADADVLLPDALNTLLADECGHAFDLEVGPLLRALLVQVNPGHMVLVLTLPTACVDQLSLLALIAEIGQLYKDGAGANLPEPLQYADYAEWRHERLANDDPEAVAGRTFWKTRGDAPWETLPLLLFGREAASDDARVLRSLQISIDPDVLSAIPDAAAGARTTHGVFLEAAWHALVARLTGADSLAIGGLLHGRHHAELEGAVGLFAQVAPIRSRVDAGTTFAEVLEQVRLSRADAERRQDYRSIPDRSPAIGFELIELAGPQRLGDAGVVVKALRTRLEPQTLRLVCRVEDGRSVVDVEFDPAVYSEDTVEQVASSFGVLLSHAVANPNERVSRLPLLTEPERRRLLVSVNATDPDFRAAPIHRLFAEHAARAPDKTAVIARGRSLTYGELDTAANRLANKLHELGAGPDAVVGLGPAKW
jgi:hypothetical protein